MITSKNNPQNKEINYIATVKFYVKANNEDNAKLKVMDAIDDLNYKIDWCFDTVVNNESEYNKRQLELRRLEQK
jgi:hypothetical protein